MRKEWRIAPENDDFLLKHGHLFCNSRYARTEPANPVYPPTNLSDLWAFNGPERANRSTFYAMGHAVRTGMWRYVEWVHWDAAADGPDWSQPLLGRELYDHQRPGLSNADFDSFENVNQADGTFSTRFLMRFWTCFLKY